LWHQYICKGTSAEASRLHNITASTLTVLHDFTKQNYDMWPIELRSLWPYNPWWKCWTTDLWSYKYQQYADDDNHHSTLFLFTLRITWLLSCDSKLTSPVYPPLIEHFTQDTTLMWRLSIGMNRYKVRPLVFISALYFRCCVSMFMPLPRVYAAILYFNNPHFIVRSKDHIHYNEVSRMWSPISLL